MWLIICVRASDEQNRVVFIDGRHGAQRHFVCLLIINQLVPSSFVLLYPSSFFFFFIFFSLTFFTTTFSFPLVLFCYTFSLHSPSLYIFPIYQHFPPFLTFTVLYSLPPLFSLPYCTFLPFILFLHLLFHLLSLFFFFSFLILMSNLALLAFCSSLAFNLPFRPFVPFFLLFFSSSVHLSLSLQSVEHV